MGLKSFFSRRQAQDAPPPAPRSRPRATQGDADTVQQARIRARQRLTGAAVLLGIGIIGFPLLFETQPRPIPVDLPITIPNKDNAAPLAAPQPHSAGVAAQTAAASNATIEETSADAGRDLPEPAASAAVTGPGAGSAPKTMTASADKPEKPAAATPPKSSDRAERAASQAPSDKPSGKAASPVQDTAPKLPATPRKTTTAALGAGDGAARAKALLDGKAASDAAAARFVVQVGAFADAGAAHQARLKVEKLGLKTYTQAVDTSAGRRIRVRVGPFASRDDATAAAAKLHAAGLPSAVLTL